MTTSITPPVKVCACCGKPLKRKRYSTGNLEAAEGFRRRRYCDRACMGKHKDWHTRPVVGRR